MNERQEWSRNVRKKRKIHENKALSETEWVRWTVGKKRGVCYTMEALESRLAIRDVSALDVPENLPYRDRLSLDACPESGEELCARCGKCEEVCPQEAITVGEEKIATDKEKCIRCCACVKTCPTGAGRVTYRRIPQTVQKLTTLCPASERAGILLRKVRTDSRAGLAHNRAGSGKVMPLEQVII